MKFLDVWEPVPDKNILHLFRVLIPPRFVICYWVSLRMFNKIKVLKTKLVQPKIWPKVVMFYQHFSAPSTLIDTFRTYSILNFFMNTILMWLIISCNKNKSLMFHHDERTNFQFIIMIAKNSSKLLLYEYMLLYQSTDCKCYA